MQDLITAILLGVIEGITEMLPISSTGHLILANQWLSFGGEFTKLFIIVIQCGAILAVLLYFWNTLSPFGNRDRKKIFRLWKLILVGIAPILIIGYLAGGDILDVLFDPIVVAVALIVNGILLIVIERSQQGRAVEVRSLESLRFTEVVFVGLVHVLGLIPGMSRSASGTIGGMAVGIDRTTSSQFSMLMAIPTLAAASVYSLITFDVPIMTREWGLLFTGFLVSFAVCYVAVRWFFSFINSYGLRPFGYYRIVLGVIILTYFML